MPAWASSMADLLWGNALAVVPLTLLVALACRCLPCRPATRHALWLSVLLWFVLPTALPRVRFLESVVSAVVEEPRSSSTHAEPSDIGVAAPRPALPEPFVPEHARSEPSVRSVAGGVPDLGPPLLPAWDAARQTRGALVDPPEDPSCEVVGGVPPQSPVADPGREASKVQGWWSAPLAVFGMVQRLPRMPTGIWLAGIAVFVTVRLVRVAHAHRLLGGAVAAPASVTRMVAEVAAGYRLRTVPQAWMVRADVSPLIWCGRSVRLILPRQLWSELDPTGRRAIICHELAHLRRKDHWVCRGEVLIRGLFWWHPLAWWIARRLREEAELCCDAWVTWLMPRGRREYAQALLQTKAYLSHARVRVPAVGMGAMTNRARRFARRLKMVMTERTRPGLSLTGVVLAVAVVAAGWLVNPAYSCDSKSKSAKKDKRTASMAVVAPAAPERPAVSAAPPLPPLPALSADEVNTFEAHVAGRRRIGGPAPPVVAEPAGGMARLLGALAGGGAPAAPGKRPDELERRLERLERQMERLMERLERMDAREPRPGREHEPPRPPPEAPPPPPPPGGDQIVVRAYPLPEGKLKALSELMIREDVPIRVRPLPDRLEVHATERQHRIFRAFVRLIHPDGGGPEDEPEPDVAGPRAERAARTAEEARRAQALMEELERARVAAREQIEGQRESLEDMRRALERQHREMEQQRRELERKRRELDEQRESLERQKAELEERRR